MATGFEDDLALGSEESSGGMELTDREVAIAAGENPDSVGEGMEEAQDEAHEDSTEEADSTEAVEEEGGAAEVDGTDAADTWVNDDIKALAEMYGISEDGLATFDSEGEFRKFASLMDKYAAGDKAKEEPAAEETSEATDDDLDPKKFEEDGYDENTVKIVDTLVKSKATVTQLVDRIAKLESMLEESSKQQETTLLHRAIDEIGGRFGSGGSLTDEQKAARDKLLESAEIVKQSLEKRGDKVVNASVLLRRAELLAFGDEIIAEEAAKAKEAFAEKVKKQSAKRRPVGRNTKPPARQALGEADNPVKAIANSPELVEFWKNLED